MKNKKECYEELSHLFLAEIESNYKAIKEELESITKVIEESKEEYVK